LKTLQKTDHAKIYETNHFKDGIYFIEKYRSLSTKMLALFDLDNTILSYRHTLGTDQWFDFDFNEFISQGKSPQQAKENTLQSYLNFVNKIHTEDVYAIEEDTPAQIRSLQTENVETLLLTSRGSYLLETTNQQIQKFELNFNTGAYQDKEKKLTLSPEGLFTQGMILTGGSNKGECLLECFEDDNIPDFIIMWDDKQSNLEKVRDALKKYNDKKLEQNKAFKPIEFIGIRYSKLDPLIHNVNPDIIALQKRYFERILSDYHASLILKAESKSERRNFVDIDYKPELNCVTLAICKANTYTVLKDIEPDIDKYRIVGAIKKFNNKEKLAWQFKFSIKEFEPLFHKLSQHGLIESSQFDMLSPLFNLEATFTPAFGQFKKQASNDDSLATKTKIDKKTSTLGI